ncbi:MAG: VanZ family protein [Brevundimonas sp.]|uniref:VanZ family protein n=1 Tax=Brevundimonas sp. TaxID=1871086 RepID=UPI002489DDF7|nr:VanZ family protein [Brevundimonas sp.]MDI1327711.1 VanZ family protein [Brevundimonas sp.]
MRLTAVVLLVVIIGSMVGPFQNVEAAANVWDKAAHFVAFGLILWSIGVLLRRLPRTLAALSAFLLGGTVELVQGMVGRDASWGDILADGLGILTALLLWAIWRRFEPRTAFQTSKTPQGGSPRLSRRGQG